jgi:hypothetical protein
MNQQEVPKFLFDEIRNKFTQAKPVTLEEFPEWEVLHLEKEMTWIGYREEESGDRELAIIYEHPVLNSHFIIASVEGSAKRLKIVSTTETIDCEHPAHAMLGYLIMRLTQIKHPKIFDDPMGGRMT